MRQAISSISNFIEWVCKAIGGFSVGAFVTVISIQVVFRNLLKLPIIWANDIAVVLFVWSVFFGSAIAVRHKKHYVLEFIPEKYSKLNCFLDLVGDLSGFLFFLFLIVEGYKYTIMGMSRLSPSIGLPQAYFFMCIPLSGLFMMWFNTGIFVSDVKHMISLFKAKEAIINE
ncbi:MAG TPA: TRAP transporter small permease subunit [Clostridia bacterium]|nr:TRAP transporter small permease subunit [Clostridia bacterium]